jgi:hypothetical protein
MAQVRRHVTWLDGLDANPALGHMPEKTPAIDRVLFGRKPAEVAFAHVFAQYDQPAINLMIFGNGALRGEACS